MRPRSRSRRQTATEPPEAAEAQGNAEAAKLIARASALLGRGDIGAARIVLERASEIGQRKGEFHARRDIRSSHSNRMGDLRNARRGDEGA